MVQHSAAGSGLKSWNTAETVNCLLRVANSSELTVDVLWVRPDGGETSYRVLRPTQLHIQATYSTHVWRLRVVPSERLLAEHVGADTTLEITEDGKVVVHEGYRPDIVPKGGPPPPPEWGSYRTRAVTAVGIPITAWDCVGDLAVVCAADVLERMLAGTPPAVLARLRGAGADVAIIGRNQVTSDIPAHNSLRGSDAADGKRTFDDGCRGVGGSPWIPTTSVGEENVTMVRDRWYSSENILIHEFGHSVMDIGMEQALREEVVAAHLAALEQQLYDPDCYMASNPQEYWAEGTQAWFDATVRCDVNSSINNRAALKAHDPRLAAILQQTYGEGAWRYPQTAPAQFEGHGIRAQSPWRRPLGAHGVGRRIPALSKLAAWARARMSKPNGRASLLSRCCCGCLPSAGQYAKVI